MVSICQLIKAFVLIWYSYFDKKEKTLYGQFHFIKNDNDLSLETTPEQMLIIPFSWSSGICLMLYFMIVLCPVDLNILIHNRMRILETVWLYF